MLVSKPLGIPFDLPTHLRDCAQRYTGRPFDQLRTRADLLLALDVESGERDKAAACIAEIARLVDKHNDAMNKLGQEKK